MYKDKEKEKRKYKRYYKNHPLKRLAKAIFKRDKNSKIKAKDLWRLAKKQKMRCALTGEKLTNENVSPDHIIPLSRNGGSEIENIQLVIQSVNLAKHYMEEKEFILLCKKVIDFKQR